MSIPPPEFLRFTGHKSFAHRLLLSTLSGRPIHISQIRSSSTNPGLAPHEISLLRLFDSVTNGSSIQISYTGTSFTYIPGIVTGGITTVESDCVKCILPSTCTRGVSWFLQPLCLLGPFSKSPLRVRFEGDGVITSSMENGDISVDTMRTAVLPYYEHFGISTNLLELRVLQRSCAGPNGIGGRGIVELRFGCQLRLPKTAHLNRCPGRIKRIRGVAYCTGVSANGNMRMIHAARNILNPLLCDINIATQYNQAAIVIRGDAKIRFGIGFGLSLIAETTCQGVIYSADVSAKSKGGVTSEEIGRNCALQLLETISQGGFVTRVGSMTVLTLMTMGSEDIGRVRISREVLASEHIIDMARDFKKFGASSWGLRDTEDDDSGDIIISVKGMGIGNVGKKIA
ncbi:RNA 3'-terminal phosphate cyclase-like protein [Erysiphe neolycopersici]|uniref:RNA 3'-terminal phosphate cyclase-like protein n=1 Tax=Erysiphe neolycopersici TaxID=212602 RepID=A0A420HNN8_9PEZI|nr:RNA 3'-terminal phosphate cyclase-like protein [Erysiphe neolycopersici]